MTADHITRCSRNLGWHAFAAGPCFNTEHAAVAYRDKLQHFGLTWKSQDESWPLVSLRTGIELPNAEVRRTR